jgi:hypothetical protein
VPPKSKVDMAGFKPGRKIDLPDVTFLMVAKYDHPERAENFNLIIAWFRKYFNTNISICEINGNKFECFKKYAHYERVDAVKFIRPFMFNQLIKSSKTEINFLWDSDIYVPPRNIKNAVDMLRAGSSFVYPYKDIFYLMPRTVIDLFKATLDLSLINIPMPSSFVSYGGAFGFRKSAYMEIGLENENLSGYVPDDIERLERVVRLGGGYEMVGDALYHLEHYRGPDSRLGNPSMVKNYLEVLKEKDMTDQELREYVNTWNR